MINEIEPHVDKWHEQGIVDRDAFLKAGEQGLLCMWADEKYGGAGMQRFSLTNRYYARRIANTVIWAFFIFAQPACRPVYRRSRYRGAKAALAAQVRQGEYILAVAMTEAGAGSDLSGIRTKAEDKGDHYLLNGSKTFISNGILADLVIVAARTDPTSSHGMSLLVVNAVWRASSAAGTSRRWV